MKQLQEATNDDLCDSFTDMSSQDWTKGRGHCLKLENLSGSLDVNTKFCVRACI